jgi:hypothetical protein
MRATSWTMRILATLGYGMLTLVVVLVLGILDGQQSDLAEAISTLFVLSAGIAAFFIGTRRWRALRSVGALIGSSLLLSWITPIVNQEVTIYNAMCEPIDYEFWECEMRGGSLTPVDSERFRVDRSTQTVFRFGGRFGSTYHFKKCAVADRLNWSCHYNDDSGIVEVTEGRYRGLALNEKDAELFKNMKSHSATGQVSYLRWLGLYLPPVVEALTPTSWKSSAKQERPPRQ